MKFVRNLFSHDVQGAEQPPPSSNDDTITDGALDTLECVIRTMGSDSFPLADEADSSAFAEQCDEFATHVENGAAVTSAGIIQSIDGAREWGQVRRFFIDRRHNETEYVTSRVQDYRACVEDLVTGLRQIGQRDQDTEQSVKQSLDTIDRAVGAGALPEIRVALQNTIKNVSETFTEQKRNYEEQIRTLNDRMSNLRKDLVVVREEMKRDTLTEVFNRGAFDAAIKRSVNTYFILKQPTTLVMIDIDAFKSVNDKWGHAAGDDVLRSIGECLERSFIRKSDIVARYGGDEFGIILNDTTAIQSKALIERFFEQLKSVVVPYSVKGTTVTCSAGYTEIGADDSVESLIVRADKALYQAKASGRDCAEFFPPNDE